MRALTLATGIAFVLSNPVWAKSGDKPATTPTSASCTSGQIYDADAKACVDAVESSLTDEDRMKAIKELAFTGDYNGVFTILDALDVAGTADALTMRGFATRKSGDFDGAIVLYEAALALDPNHWDARSYLGQGYVEAGQSDAARAQLTLIRTTGGRGTWAEISLRQAIERGAGYSY